MEYQLKTYFKVEFIFELRQSMVAIIFDKTYLIFEILDGVKAKLRVNLWKKFYFRKSRPPPLHIVDSCVHVTPLGHRLNGLGQDLT